MVMVLHTLQTRELKHSVPFVFLVFGNGGMGVSIFFVISGYLITTLLLREREKTGTISLTSFYIRRAFRILPPLYLYVLFLAVLGLTGHLPGMDRREVLTALTFTRNYLPTGGQWALEHLWTLCIEEQFYLLWPALLVFSLVHRNSIGKRRTAICIALAVIAIEPFIRVGTYLLLPKPHNPGMFHMEADTLMFGALGALLQGNARFESGFRRVTRWPWLVPILLFFGSGVLSMRFLNYWNFPVGTTVTGFLILIWLLWLVRNPESVMGRVMNQPAVAWVGRLSYSLYIWQTFFLYHSNVTVFGREGWFNTFPGSWFCIFAVAVFSFYCIEQPSLRLRDVVMRRIHWREI